MTTTHEKQTRRPHWYGLLCAETVDEIADRMREVLDGHYFTTVLCNSYNENTDRYSSVEVRPSQRITSPITSRTPDEDGYLGISWGVTRWSMGVSTKARTQQEGRDGRPHDYCLVVFEPDKVTIDHYAPAGYALKWVFAVEHHEDES